MKLGMPILYEFNSIKDNIELAKQLKLDFIELNLNFGYCRKEIEFNEEIITLMKDSGLEFTLHFYDEADFASYDEVVEGYLKLLKKFLLLVKDIDIKMLNIHLNVGPVVTISGVKNYIYDKEYDLFITKLIKNLNLISEECDKYNINLVIENVKIPKFLQQAYLDLAKEGFSFNYDIGHDHTSNDCLRTMIEKNHFVFKEFHIHDSTQNKDHLQIGKGELDIKFYKQLAIESYVVLEVKSKEDLIESVSVFNRI